MECNEGSCEVFYRTCMLIVYTYMYVTRTCTCVVCCIMLLMYSVALNCEGYSFI